MRRRCPLHVVTHLSLHPRRASVWNALRQSIALMLLVTGTYLLVILLWILFSPSPA